MPEPNVIANGHLPGMGFGCIGRLADTVVVADTLVVADTVAVAGMFPGNDHGRHANATDVVRHILHGGSLDRHFRLHHQRFP